MDETYTAKVKVMNPNGLHIRAAALLYKVSRQYSSKVGILNGIKPEHSVEIINGKEYANAKSITSILCIAAECGHEVEIATEGKDAKPCLESIIKLFNSGFNDSN